MKVFKKDRFSIRKIKGVVGSVFLGSLLMAPSVVDAATYHYVDKEVISQEAKDLIQTGKPDGNELVYGLVYQKDQLPQTGTEASVLTAFGLLTVGSLLLIYKRKKIASVFLVGAMGLVVLPSAGAVDPVATLAPASREGVVEMEGYRYVGYLSGDILKTLGLDTVLEEASAKPGEVTVVEVENPQVTTNQEQARPENQAVETEEAPKEEAPKTEESPKEEPKSEVKPTDDTLPKVEEGKEDSVEPAPVEEVSGVVESKTDEQAPVKPESQPSDKLAEESKVEPPVDQPKVPEQPVQPTQPEQPSTPKESSQQEDPKEDKVSEETPKQEDAQPEVVETRDGAANQPVEEPKVETPAVEKQTEPKVEQAGEPVAPSEDEKAPVESEKQPEASEEEKASEETPKQEESTPDTKTEETVEHQDEVPKVEHKTTPEEGVLNVIEIKPEVIVTKESVPFKTIEQDDENLAKGETKVLREGVAGERTILTEVTTIDGKQSSKVLEDKVTTQPVDEIKGVGTKEPVDKSELKNQIDKASSVSPTDYSTASYNALGSVLETAKTTHSSESVKQEQVDSETAKLKTAIEALTVDKTELNSTITDAKTKTKEHYSNTSWQNLQTEVTEAEKVAANTDAKQSEVDSETASLKTAISGLNTDKAELENQLKIAQGKTETDFSMESWTILSTAQNKAQEVKNNGTATQDQINEAEQNLKTALAGLTVDKSQLESKLTDAASKVSTDYSKTSWEKMTVAKETATVVKENQEAKQSQIDESAKALETALADLSVDKTALESAIDTATKKNKENYTNQTWAELETVLTAAKSVNTNESKQSEVNEATEKLTTTIEKLIELSEKPILTLTSTDKKILEREAVAKYTLTSTKAEIKSITAILKKGEEVINTVVLTDDKLTTETISAAFKNLEYFKEYTLSTTMVYDRGDGDITETLENQNIQLDLKKVEIKNIKETSLISVDANGNETDSSLLETKPTDVATYYLRVTTHDNKVTRLSVDKIEEVEEGGKTLFKVTATAPDLIQRNSENKLSETYTHYFEKQKAKEDNVYYNFNELITDMQKNPNGIFKLGADLNAANVKPNGKSYVTKPFTGKLSSNGDNRFTIHNTTRPLFENIQGGNIHDINLANVDINMPGDNQVAPIANVIKGGTTIENVKVTGNVLGRDWVSGFIDKIDSGGKLINVAFIGNVTSVGTGGNFLTGIVGENWKGYVERAYVEANIKGKRAKAAGIAYWSQNGGDNFAVGREGAIKKSVVKGTIDVENPIEVGGAVGSLNMHGSIEDSVSMMKVETGEIFYGSHDISGDPYWTGNNVKRNYVVKDVSKGTSSYKHSKELHRIKPITQEEADKKIRELAITADKYAITDPIVNKLNGIKPKSDTYKDTQDYKADRELAYRNIEKLQPFYNKEWIVNQGNKLTDESNLVKKTVLSVTGMKAGQFVTDLSSVDKIMIHYADGTKEEMGVTSKDSKVAQVREYSIAELGEIVYTPNIVDKERNEIMSAIKNSLSSVELESDGVRAILNKRDTKNDSQANSPQRQNNYIRLLYLEESFKEVKDNLDTLIKHLVENEDHQLNLDESAKRALVKKVDDNKAKIMMGLAYLNQYYGFKYGELSIKDIMMFKPDFYGKNVNVLDFLIKVGSKENNVKGDRTLESYRETIGGTIGISELNGFLHYNMKLFTNHTDINDWFKKAIEKNAYVVEQPSTNPAFANKKYRLYEGINNGQHGRMILPLLNLKNAHLFMISTYNTISFSSFEKYGKDTAEKREAFKSEIDKRAKEQVNYLDFWSRLATDNVRDKLLKSQNVVPTPVWDNHDAPGGWPDRLGHRTNKPDYAPIREFFGRIDKYHAYKPGYGAYAYIFADPQPMDAVYFVMSNLISEYGTSAFTHETTHVNDRMAYLGGWRHREGTDVEAFAQGMLQSPATQGHQGEYGALGLNMAFERPNDGNQWYNTNPNDLKSREAIDNYMKGYNDTLMMLDNLEADAVLGQNSQELNNAWFKKVDKQMRGNSKNQYDNVRGLNDTEKAIQLHSVNDLVDNNFMTNRGPGNGVYKPDDFASAYVNVPMMTGIYGGNTSEGAPGGMSFKHNTFRLWGYYGYEKGFLGYATNKYKQEAKAAGKNTLGDDFIISKISEGQFANLEEFKKAYYKEVKDKATNGLTTFEVNGTNISSYNDLLRLFKEAAAKDAATLKTEKNGNKSVSTNNVTKLKEAVYKKLLQQTDSFKTSIFK